MTREEFLAKYKDGSRDFRGVNLSDANLRGANLRGADFRGANLRTADLSDANLTGANLTGADLTGADLRRADLKDTNLTGAHLGAANLSGADLCGADFNGANLSGSDLTGANLTGADLTRANLTGAKLRGATLDGDGFKVLYGHGHRDFQGVNLTDADDLSGAYLAGADLTGASLTEAYLCGAKFVGAHLTGANLTGADLTGADLRRADLKDTNLTGAHLGAANLSGADLCGADFNGANLSGSDLTGANLTGADLTRANLTGAKLRGATLDGDGFKVLYAQDHRDFQGVNLTDADLSGANLSGADLTGANLSSANLSGADLTGTTLYDSDLTGADFSGANLGGINLAKATGIETVVVNEHTQFVAVNFVGVPTEDEQLGVSAEDLYALFMSTYHLYAPLSADAVTGAASAQGFFAKGLASIAAAVSGSYPKELADQKDLNDFQRLLRIKHYADSKPDTDTAKAWGQVERVTAYRVKNMSGSSALLCLPDGMTLSFDHEKKCNGFRVDEDLNPAKYQHVYDHARARCLKALDIPEGEQAHWVLFEDPNSHAYTLVGIAAPQAVQGGPAAGGGGAAAMDGIGRATDEAGPAAVTPAKHR